MSERTKNICWGIFAQYGKCPIFRYDGCIFLKKSDATEYRKKLVKGLRGYSPRLFVRKLEG